MFGRQRRHFAGSVEQAAATELARNFFLMRDGSVEIGLRWILLFDSANEPVEALESAEYASAVQGKVGHTRASILDLDREVRRIGVEITGRQESALWHPTEFRLKK
jgi:hypothetical protein